MGTYICIEKVHEKNNVYCYKVSPPSYKCDPFFITIAFGSTKVNFYKDQDCRNLLGYVDFAHKENLVPINGRAMSIVVKVAVRVYRALQKGEFPRFLSIES